jgi:hypothetical protein
MVDSFVGFRQAMDQKQASGSSLARNAVDAAQPYIIAGLLPYGYDQPAIAF